MDAARSEMSTAYSRRKRYPKYLAWIAEQPCAVCGTTPVEAAHTTAPGQKGMAMRGVDLDAIPLCVEDHRDGPRSHHRLGRFFWVNHQLDRDTVIQELHRQYFGPV